MHETATLTGTPSTIHNFWQMRSDSRLGTLDSHFGIYLLPGAWRDPHGARLTLQPQRKLPHPTTIVPSFLVSTLGHTTKQVFEKTGWQFHLQGTVHL